MSATNFNHLPQTRAAVMQSLGDLLADLGEVSPTRVRAVPPPGAATLADLIQLSLSQDRIYELVDGSLVEKPMGWQESLLAMVLGRWLGNYLETNPLGVMTGPDGLTRLFGNTVRSADVSFFSWSRLPNAKLPSDPVPDLVPDFVIEIIRVGNTYGEMSRKRREFFQAGIKLIWMIDPRERSVAIYRSSSDVEVVYEGAILSGETVLPGWIVDTASLFAKLDASS